MIAQGLAAADPDAEQVHDLLRATLPDRLFEFCTPMPWTALQQMFDEPNGWGVHCYEKGCFLPSLTDAAVEDLAAHVARKVSPMSVVHLYTLDGAFSAVDDDATAFGGGRSPRLGLFAVGLTTDPQGLAAEREWVRGLAAAMAPHALGAGVYVNSMMGDDAGRVRATYGPNYARLAAVKAVYDPDNVFHRNVNVPPAS